MLLNGSQIVLETLKEQGVDTIFGYPGGTIINIYDELYKYGDTFKHILTAHEQAAAHAADGYARATGKVGVCFATSGPGATNLVTGIATAYLDSIPIVAITANVSNNLIGRDTFQEVDISGITMPITKHNFLVKDVEDLAATVRKAFKIAKSGRKGPVLIDIPKDVTSAICEYVAEPEQEAKPTKLPSENSIKRAVELLRNAKRPLIYAGGGTILSDVGEDLITFAEKLDAPVVSTLMGIGAFPNNHPLHLGLIGMHGHRVCNMAAHNCDVLITCGARFSDRVAGSRKTFAPNAEILHIDIDAAEMDKNINSNYHVKGDLKDVIPLLTREIEQQDHSCWKNELSEYEDDFEQTDIEGFVNPKTIIEKVDEYSSDNAIIVTDVGQHQLWAAQFYKFKYPRTLLTSGGLGTMGYSLGASIGAKIGKPDREVIVFCGDGGFHMCMPELATIVSYGLNVKIFILNNSVLGMVHQWQKMFCESRFSGTEPHRNTDFVMLSEAFGVKAYRVNTNNDINSVVKEALNYNGPVVVDCRISPESLVLPMKPMGGADKNI